MTSSSPDHRHLHLPGYLPPLAGSNGAAAGLVEPEPSARKQRTMKELAICVLRAICTDDDETDDNQAAHRDLGCTSSMILRSMHLLMHQSMHDLTHTRREQAAQKNGVRAFRGSCRARAEGEEETDRRQHVCGNNEPAIRRENAVKEIDAKQAEKSGGVAYH